MTASISRCLRCHPLRGASWVSDRLWTPPRIKKTMVTTVSLSTTLLVRRSSDTQPLRPSMISKRRGLQALGARSEQVAGREEQYLQLHERPVDLPRSDLRRACGLAQKSDVCDHHQCIKRTPMVPQRRSGSAPQAGGRGAQSASRSSRGRRTG